MVHIGVAVVLHSGGRVPAHPLLISPLGKKFTTLIPGYIHERRIPGPCLWQRELIQIVPLCLVFAACQAGEHPSKVRVGGWHTKHGTEVTNRHKLVAQAGSNDLLVLFAHQHSLRLLRVGSMLDLCHSDFLALSLAVNDEGCSVPKQRRTHIVVAATAVSR